MWSRQLVVLKLIQYTIPLSIARLVNRIVSVCAFLSNFQSVLVPLPPSSEDSDVIQYFMHISVDSVTSDSEESDSIP